MKRTEKPSKPAGAGIWNRILAAMLIFILVLAFVLGFLILRQGRDLDLGSPYVPKFSGDSGTEVSFGKAEPFAEGLCVSEENVLSQEIALGSQEERGLLFNLETGEVLFSQNIYQRTYPASITKIMTAVLALEYGNMEDTVTITAQDLSLEEGSQMSGMEAGDTVTMDQLFHTLVVYSANDAAMAIARQVGGSVDHFVEMMNQKAKELGMTGTHFVNPHGLHQEEHYTTPYDVYLMLHYASQIPEFLNTAGLASYQLDLPAAGGRAARTLYLSSTDQYLTGGRTAPKNVSVLGGKTGTTPEAGSNLAIVVQNSYGIPYMAIIMNAENSAVLYSDMDQLLSLVNGDV